MLTSSIDQLTKAFWDTHKNDIYPVITIVSCLPTNVYNNLIEL